MYKVDLNSELGESFVMKLPESATTDLQTFVDFMTQYRNAFADSLIYLPIRIHEKED